MCMDKTDDQTDKIDSAYHGKCFGLPTKEPTLDFFNNKISPFCNVILLIL